MSENRKDKGQNMQRKSGGQPRAMQPDSKRPPLDQDPEVPHLDKKKRAARDTKAPKGQPGVDEGSPGRLRPKER